MNPYDEKLVIPNYWLSCMLIRKEAMCEQTRSATRAFYIAAPGKTCPTEILETLAQYNAEGRPIWKPMHMQPLYAQNSFVTASGDGHTAKENGTLIVGEDIFDRGLCLPSDIRMTADEQDRVIEIIRSCFNR